MKLSTDIEVALRALGESEVRVGRVAPMPGGACQESFRVELIRGAREENLVLRSDSPRHLPGSLARRDEYRVAAAAAEGGVKTPQVRWPMEDLVREGASAYFMDEAPGIALGRKVVSSPELAGARAKLPRQLARELAKIHRITPTTHPGLFPEPLDAEVGEAALDAQLARNRRAMDELDDLHPALELGLAWLEDHRPPMNETVLCHGDFRIGNFLISADNGLEAILDWEFAHWSAPADDIAWGMVRDWRFGELAKPAFGLTGRDELLAYYFEASGRSIDRGELSYWEVMGNLRWAIAARHQGLRYARGERQIELFAIDRRAIEIEFEVLRRIEEIES